jgi:Type IV secretion system pilin
MSKKLLRRVGFAVWLGGFAFANFAFADSGPLTLPNPLGSQSSFTSVVANVTGFLLNDIAIPLTAIMALVGGFQMITAAGDPEKFSSGRKTLTYAVIGFVVVLLASSVVSIIKSIFATGS